MLSLNNYIWSVANKLVKNYGYSALNLDDASKEASSISLIKNLNGKYFAIRLVPIQQYVWPNHLINDLSNLQKIDYKVANKPGFFNRKMNFFNLYIFQSTPSKEIENIIFQSPRLSNKKIDFLVGFIDLEAEKINFPEDFYRIFAIKDEPFEYFLKNPMEEDFLDVAQEIEFIEAERTRQMKAIYLFGKPIITYSLIIINAIIFLLMTLNGGSTSIKTLLEFGAIEPYLITQGQYWRLLTPIFLHIGFIHFALNNLAIYYIGRLTEKIYGSSRFLVIYLLAGIIGNISSFLFLPTVIGAGASGAIFGLLGALLYFGYVHPTLFIRTIGKDIVFIIGINVLFGLSVPSVNMYAHMGGLIGGFLASAIVYLPKQKEKKPFIRIIAILLIVVISASTWWGINGREVKGSPDIYLVGQSAKVNNHIEEANNIFAHLVKYYPMEPLFHYQYAETLFIKGLIKNAEEQYQIALKIEPKFTDAHYKLALIYYFNMEYQKAKNELHIALQLSPDFKKAEELLKEINNANTNN